MYDGSAQDKTRRKIYYEPIENMMFDNFVLIGIWLNRLFLLKSQPILVNCKHTT